jgi:tetratricopeptide (TPR) repeat protein
MATRVKINKATALLNAGRLREAVAILENIEAKKPAEARVLHLLGVANARLGKSLEAENLLKRAHDASPRSAALLTDLSTLLVITNRNAEALSYLDNALRLEPNSEQALFYRAVALTNLNRTHEALNNLDQLTAINPSKALYQHNRASLLVQCGRYDEAEALVNRVLAQQLGYPPSLLLKGLIEMNRERFSDAIGIFDQIIAREPTFHEAIFNRGIIRMLTGEMASGWRDLESRWYAQLHLKPDLAAPHWSGESLEGRSLLVYCEQGFGDIFMFCRYLPLLAKQGAEVFFLVPDQFIRLLQGLSADIQVVSTIPRDRDIDFQIALMSLPYRLGTDLTNIPSDVPYLFADPIKVAYWRDIIGSNGFKIGINWQGNPKAKVDLGRSIPLRAFYPISQVPGARLISLQKNVGLEQLSDIPSDMTVETFEGSGTDGFIDTSAIMRNMDLIISADTSIAHLAGALAIPVWIVVKRIPDWRWMLEREDSPWFPTLRLFRQSVNGVWLDVFEKIAIELTTRISQKVGC